MLGLRNRSFRVFILHHRGASLMSAAPTIAPPSVAMEFEKGDLRFTMISTFGTPQDVTADEIRVKCSIRRTRSRRPSCGNSALPRQREAGD